MSILSDIRRGEALYSSGRNNNPYDLVRANVALSEARTTERNKESGKILSEMNTAIPGVFVEGGTTPLTTNKDADGTPTWLKSFTDLSPDSEFKNSAAQQVYTKMIQESNFGSQILSKYIDEDTIKNQKLVGFKYINEVSPDNPDGRQGFLPRFEKKEGRPGLSIFGGLTRNRTTDPNEKVELIPVQAMDYALSYTANQHLADGMQYSNVSVLNNLLNFGKIFTGGNKEEFAKKLKNVHTHSTELDTTEVNPETISLESAGNFLHSFNENRANPNLLDNKLFQEEVDARTVISSKTLDELEEKYTKKSPVKKAPEEETPKLERREENIGTRPDGTPKLAFGWKGRIKMNPDLPFNDPKQSYMTEKTLEVEFDGQSVNIPAIVPGTLKNELELMRDNEDWLKFANTNKGGQRSREERTADRIITRAENHAKRRLAKGKSPYVEPGDREYDSQVGRGIDAGKPISASVDETFTSIGNFIGGLFDPTDLQNPRGRNVSPRIRTRADESKEDVATTGREVNQIKQKFTNQADGTEPVEAMDPTTTQEGAKVAREYGVTNADDLRNIPSREAARLAAIIAMSSSDPVQRVNIYGNLLDRALLGGLSREAFNVARGQGPKEETSEQQLDAIKTFVDISEQTNKAIFTEEGVLKEGNEIKLGIVDNKLSELKSYIENAPRDTKAYKIASQEYIPAVMSYLIGAAKVEGTGSKGFIDWIRDNTPSILGGNQEITRSTINRLAEDLTLDYEKSGGQFFPQNFQLRGPRGQERVEGITYGSLENLLETRDMRNLEFALALRELQKAQASKNSSQIQKYTQIINQLSGLR